MYPYEGVNSYDGNIIVDNIKFVQRYPECGIDIPLSQCAGATGFILGLSPIFIALITISFIGYGIYSADLRILVVGFIVATMGILFSIMIYGLV